MTTTTILSDNGVSSGTAGIKTTGGNDGTLQLQTTTSGGTATTAVTIDTSQNVGIGALPSNYRLNVKGIMNLEAISGSTNGWNLYTYTDSSLRINYNGAGADEVMIDTSGNLLVGVTTAYGGSGLSLGSPNASGSYSVIAAGGGGYHWRFGNVSNGIVGAITTTTVATTYATSSDYRLKENVQPMHGALALVTQLKPCTYKWKTDGSDGQGFIAHELQAVVPDAVVGEKDAVDEHGNPKYQGIDTSFLVATLTAAIQEQQTIIEQLRADVAQLKGAQS